MATVRRGLPRTPGGEAWPPAGVVVASAGVVERAPAEPARDETRFVVEEAPGKSVGDDVSSRSPAASSLNDPGAAVARSGSALRRGLPRVAGGDPWPPAAVAASTAAVGAGAPAHPLPVVERAPAEPARDETRFVTDDVSSRSPAASSLNGPGAGGGIGVGAGAPGSVLRRGLPRVAGGEAWPPAGTAFAAETVVAAETVMAERTTVEGEVVETVLVQSAIAEPGGVDVVTETTVAIRPDVSIPLPFTRTVWNGSAPRHVAAEPASSKLRPTWPQALGGLFGAAGLAVLAGAAIVLVRAFLSLPFMQDFLTTYPGEYHLPAGAPVGIPAWIGWQHFFNIFLMTLIIRSGLTVRREKRPTAFWTPRGNPKGKISLTLWFHQGLDLLWIVNGAMFIVLLFVTGQWIRIVPTSWDVFPNALSAALQYVSFDWPTENSWVNYNSLQQLAYFTIVFLAAPVAIVTGFRMSGLWPKKAEGLSKAYPIEIARALHFPTMLFFTAFIVVHVALVLLTGMLRNLNHMFASQDAMTWTGFWVFVLAMVAVAAGWVAARPLVLAPIAKLFGSVSGR